MISSRLVPLTRASRANIPTSIINLPLIISRNASISSKKTSKPAKQSAFQTRPSISKIGVPLDTFIPLRPSRQLALLTKAYSPKLFLTSIFKRIFQSSINVYHRYQFIKTMNLTPETKNRANYIKFVNQAIEIFITVNKSFSSRKLDKLPIYSEFVYASLSSRLARLPKNLKIDWQLIKFNSKVKLVSFQSLPHTDGSILCLQAIYKFNTKQKFTIVNQKTNEVNEETKDVIEYLVFNFDPYTDEACLAGSLFESLPDQPFSPTIYPDQTTTVKTMVLNGDIYRSEPDIIINKANLKLVE